MAQYYQVQLEQGEKPTTEELQTLYPNLQADNQPTVRYIINSEGQQLQQSQPVIIAADQYMVVDNVIDQSAVAFPNTQFELQPGQQQIYYMENKDGGGQPLHAATSQPVVLNHQLQTGAPPPKAAIMLQPAGHGQPTMVIQQPAVTAAAAAPLLQRRVPVQKAVAGPQRVVVAQSANSTHRLVRTNILRGNTPRYTPVPVVGNPVVRNAAVRNAIRTGVMANRMPLLPETQPKPLNSPSIPRTSSPLNEETVEGVALEDGRIVSIAEYKQMLKEKQKLQESKANNTSGKPPPKATPKRPNRAPPVKTPKGPFPPQQQPKPTTPQLPPQQQNVAVEPQQQQASSPMHKSGARIISPSNQGSRLTAMLRNFVPPPEIREIISKTSNAPEFKDSIRMFVLQANGEQRLITFTMPKEDCTIQEILEQVGVPLQPDTKIAVSETNTDGINFVVTVGFTDEDCPPLEPAEPEEPPPRQPPKPPTPELPAPPEPEMPKLVPGMLAVCTHCGFLSDDFNKCIRCKSKLPDQIKAVPAEAGVKKAVDQLKKPTIAIHLKNNGLTGNAKVASPAKRKPPVKKVVEQEAVVLTLSSDEEEEDDQKCTIPTIEHLKKKAEESEANPKEPTANDLRENDIRKSLNEGTVETANVTTSIFCRTIRIGSYRFTPVEDVIINNKEMVMKVPSPKDPREIHVIRLERQSIVKVLATFQKIMPVVFYYVVPSAGEAIRKALDMSPESDYYFDPLSKEEAFKRITLLPETITEDIKSSFKLIYGEPFSIIDELSPKEANNILIRTCPREVARSINTLTSSCAGISDVRQLLIYPAGKGGLSINTEDYMCLAQEQFLNDVIIDFYLKYLVLNLPSEQQEKIHVFSTFFYKRLTTRPTKPTKKTHPTELDPNLTAAQKRHHRVKNWTKNVNLFEKDYIIVPINENAHWFLAIICFPGMNGPHTFDGKPHKVEPTERKKKLVTQIGNVTITQIVADKPPTVTCDDGEGSDKDEAEANESELDSGEESEEPNANPPTAPKTRVPIKQPCILIFDSLAGASRARVVATLRDYLTCEYKAKMGKVKVFNKDVIKGNCPKVPQQTNYTDCGLYLLQYVESFLMMPIEDYHLPIKDLKTWFEEIVVTRKREDISLLIKDIMEDYNKDTSILPDIRFPTLNGEIVEHPPEEDEEESMMEEEEFEEDTEKELSEMGLTESDTDNVPHPAQEPEIPSPEKMSDYADEAMADAVPPVPKPDDAEVPRPTSRDTLMYLKTKRIVRHKTPDAVDVKKFKLSND